MLKELKLIFKSITFYLFAVTVILFYITQYGYQEPLNAGKPIQPLSEMQFMYTKLLEDYQDGKLTNNLIKDTYQITKMDPAADEESGKRYEKANNYQLDGKEKEAVREAIVKMNTGAFERDENILKIKFSITYAEYLELMRKLDEKLGGFTYYWDREAKRCLLAEENSYGTIEDSDSLERLKYTYLQMKASWSSGNVRTVRAGVEYSKPVDAEQKMLIEAAMKKILPDGFTGDEDPHFNISYEEGLNIVRDLDRKLGVNQFEKTMLGVNVIRGLTYEEAMKNFSQLFGSDELTNAYARCLSDYMGVTAGFLPIFLAAFVLIRDYRSRMAELIYCRKATSFAYVSSKFAAISISVMLCYLGIAVHSTITFAELAGIYGYHIDYLAFFKYILAWVMPTVMFTTAMGLFLSILFGNGIIAVAVQLVLWCISVMPLGGDYRLFKHIIRFNTVAGYEQYESWFPAIMANRIFFTLLSFGLVAAASAVLAWRRSSGSGTPAGFIKRPSLNIAPVKSK